FGRSLGVKLSKNDRTTPTKRTPKSAPPAGKEPTTPVVTPPLPQLQQKNRRIYAVVASIIAALIALISVLVALNSIYVFFPEFVAASDLTIGDDCQLDRQAEIIGSANVTIPSSCSAVSISLYKVAEGAKLQFATENASPSSTPPPSFTGPNGNN